MSSTQSLCRDELLVFIYKIVFEAIRPRHLGQVAEIARGDILEPMALAVDQRPSQRSSREIASHFRLGRFAQARSKYGQGVSRGCMAVVGHRLGERQSSTS
jgi:hypothetical protein